MSIRRKAVKSPFFHNGFIIAVAEVKIKVSINAIYFSATPETAAIEPGDVVDVAFHAQVNEFRGERTVQMNVLDIRPSCAAPCCPDVGGYNQLQNGTITPDIAARLLPERATLSIVWRYLAGLGHPVQETPMCLCRKIVRWSGRALHLEQLLVCLDIFQDVGLLRWERLHKYITVTIISGSQKADLNTSTTMQALLRGKES